MKIPLHRSIQHSSWSIHIFYNNKMKIILHALLHYFFCCTISAHFALCTFYVCRREEKKNGQMNGEHGAYRYRPNQKFHTTACRVASSHNATLYYVATVTIALISERVNTSSTELVQYHSQNEINSHFVKYTHTVNVLGKVHFSLDYCKCLLTQDNIFIFMFIYRNCSFIPYKEYRWIKPRFSISVINLIENQSNVYASYTFYIKFVLNKNYLMLLLISLRYIISHANGMCLFKRLLTFKIKLLWWTNYVCIVRYGF